jgi:hydrogenase maturation protein HypF
MIDRGLNSPLCSSCGRLFDGISAIMNLRREITFEAQAAIELEMIADQKDTSIYRSVVESVQTLGPWDFSEMVRSVVNDIRLSVGVDKISARFHRTLVEVFVSLVELAREKTGVNVVGLSGGVYQNTLFNRLIQKRLSEKGYEVLIHSQIPPNDGGLALGQIAIAGARMRLHNN